MIELEGLTKRYDDRTVVDDVVDDDPQRLGRRHGRHVGLGQVDASCA